uniref:Uncharacterized protein n=1 Tax=Chromera velia CCMP2878 TaxID=1169474 RepID=A0A0G4HGZ1_9ALVE|eukprot:Cvel_27492.t1-p1 / transcript=Cvel_27492.t1 / gene=Cvel_27492 / organism=Chromera_velia_CCMP2878 / gene_product=hypothetical protein / transcript_product=hypothetical protein / location=Cvel_scaffold3438:328-1309(-) / protein_length=115 / sequence_SO=supercontig / SO=protein_coding / is_pseudo=false
MTKHASSRSSPSILAGTRKQTSPIERCSFNRKPAALKKSQREVLRECVESLVIPERLKPDFYLREDVVQVARDLVGKILWSRDKETGELCAGRIVETCVRQLYFLYIKSLRSRHF